MKEKIVISNIPFEGSLVFDKIYYSGKNLSKDENYLCFMDGYIVEDDFDENQIIDIYKNEGISGFNIYSGMYTLFIYDKLLRKLYVTNDFFAPRSVYYYKDSTGFVISTYFWNIIDIVDPPKENIDKEAVAQFAIYGTLLNNKTMVENVYILESATNSVYDANNCAFSSEKYDDYSSFTEDEMTLDEAVDSFHNSILKAVEFIKKKHGNERIGASISGGLDSRIIPALFGKDIKYFVIVGPERVKRWSKPSNFVYLDEIAKVYGVNIVKVSQDKTPLLKKIYLEMKAGPVRAENICKIIDKDLVGFDTLLMCGAPDLLSSSRTFYRSGWDIFDIMEKYQGHRYIKKRKKHSIKSILKFIFIDRPNTFQTYNYNYVDFFPIKGIEKKCFYKNAHKKISTYIGLENNPKDAIMKEHYELFSRDSLMGAFESLAGQMKVSYTYFYPWGYKVLKHVPFEYINQRMILKRLIEKYYPQVANISSEHSISGIRNEKKTSSWRIIKSIVNRKLGGTSSFSDLTKEQKNEALLMFDELKSGLYDSIFDSKMVRETIDFQQDVFMVHLKLKLLLSTIENKEWKKYLD